MRAVHDRASTTSGLGGGDACRERSHCRGSVLRRQGGASGATVGRGLTTWGAKRAARHRIDPGPNCPRPRVQDRMQRHLVVERNRCPPTRSGPGSNRALTDLSSPNDADAPARRSVEFGATECSVVLVRTNSRQPVQDTAWRAVDRRALRSCSRSRCSASPARSHRPARFGCSLRWSVSLSSWLALGLRQGNPARSGRRLLRQGMLALGCFAIPSTGGGGARRPRNGG